MSLEIIFQISGQNFQKNNMLKLFLNLMKKNICKEEGGIILNSALVKKYIKKNKDSCSNHNMEFFKMGKK